MARMSGTGGQEGPGVRQPDTLLALARLLQVSTLSKDGWGGRDKANV